jgi:hypothetical protein
MLSIGKLVAGAEDYYLSMVAEGPQANPITVLLILDPPARPR